MIIFLVSDPQWLMSKVICNCKHSFESYNCCFRFFWQVKQWATIRGAREGRCSFSFFLRWCMSC
jgi:predicted AAA+ superfamily ATPase